MRSNHFNNYFFYDKTYELISLKDKIFEMLQKLSQRFYH